MGDKATLVVDGKTVELDVIEGSEGERAIDISRLRSATGLVTYDPGFANTGACRSAVTYIHGEEGTLRYRGIPIEELAEHASFLETSYLLIHGELPSAAELEGFVEGIRRHTMLHEDMRRLFSMFPKNAHPMAVCSAALSALSTFYQDSLNPRNDEQVRITVTRLLAKMPTIAAYSYKHSRGQPFLYPDNRLDYPRNFLQMMFATPCEPYEPDPIIAKVLDLLLILHADHEQNCSTSTVRLVGSSLSNLFASLSAGLKALWGPLHGGANQKVIEMLETIERQDGTGAKFLARCKDQSDTTRLMGFGHRVYKNYDPRARIIKRECHRVLEHVGVSSRRLEIAMELEEVAMRDDYFISRRLYPNVDFYSGIIYEAIGIPVNMFTVMFAMGRLPGWIAQWIEMHTDDTFRIGRPRQIYTGYTKRPYVPVEKR